MENFNVKALKDMLENIFGVGSVHIYDGGKEISNKKTPCCSKERANSTVIPKENPKPSCICDDVIKGYPGYEVRVDKDKDGNRTGINLVFCVPGLSIDQISITEENNIITVSSEQEVKFFGKLYQKTKLKNIYDLEKIVAKLNNGILVIYIPVSKKAFNNVRKINIG